MKSTHALLTALLLAPLAALHAAEPPSASPAKPLAGNQRHASPPAESTPSRPADDVAALASRKPSGIPLAPILDPGPECADGKRLWQGSGSMTISPKGRVWLSWMTGGGFEGDRTQPTYVLLFTSNDGGQTCQGPVAVVKSPRGQHVQDPGLWTDPRGRLWWYYYANGGMVANIADDPEAAKPRFQPPFFVSQGFFINKPTVLADGSWLWTPHTKFPTVGFKGVTVYRSQDEGKSFAFVGSVNSKPGVDIQIGEPISVELRDGRIALFIRTLAGIRRTLCADGGRTWGDFEALPGLNAVVNSRFFVSRLKSGNLLLVYNRPPEGPDPLAAKGPLVNLRFVHDSSAEGHQVDASLRGCTGRRRE